MADQELVIFEELTFEDIEPTSMEADVGMALEGFGDEELAFAQEMEACWSLGPLRACASVVGGGEVRVSASLLGRNILSTTLSTRRTRVCVSPNVGLAKAELCIALDISRKQVRVEGRFCVRRITGSWRCTSFNSRLLSW